MVDYSKWDALQVSSSDEEGSSGARPRVRRFEERQRVTIGPDGLSIEGDDSRPCKKVEEVTDEEGDAWEEEMEGGDTAADEAYEDAHEWPRCGYLPPSSIPAAAPSNEPRKGVGNHPDASAASSSGGLGSYTPQRAQKREDEVFLIQNGGVVKGRYWWSQTKHEVTIDVQLPEGARAKDMTVEIREDGCCCMYRGTPVLKGTFPHKVEPDEEMWFWELIEKRVNWERLEKLADKVNGGTQSDEEAQSKAGETQTAGAGTADSEQTATEGTTKTGDQEGDQAGDKGQGGDGHREGETASMKEELAMFLELNLRKKPEIAGTYVWWDCVVKGDPSVDVEKLPGRAAKEATTKNFKAAWEKAHKMFLEKLKNEPREPMEI
ncbi:putative nuclear movement domain-containing protein [Neospora caninum Liverpool]|uniref:Nuclear movement domain-containing protein,putative n=1 Tax=Neospora caninum (strain Liverpool) TaxID=572307 RepID=F0VHJ3_NEOCL|nr:putative nuclear movement domain-containing protein [Neospora caninum Liverpool]CBZ53187.1 putative nuclear movement domain-containing protein [Neospora caninum Liverpool]CEL67176.1 TPA: nuclear movement domain-containing protein,putative [Neospora caninum Liverpool]|eukprot:XP_003883219.1 putative nuclear movement domain-containing protein [Neospora caninum Liverpool]